MAELVLHPGAPNQRIIQIDKPAMLIGSAPDADIHISGESISDYHARIEHKPEGDYLISLVSPSGVFIDGVETTFQQLNHGATIEIGDVTAEFRTPEADDVMADETIDGTMTQSIPPAAAGTALVASPAYASICPNCRLQLQPGMHSCPQCGMQVSNLPAMQMGYVPPTPMHQAGPGILPVLAFLAGLTIIGAPVALVLGLICLAIIRRQGGTTRDHVMSKWAIGLGLVWLMLAVATAGGYVWRAHRRAQLGRIDVYEAKVIRALKNLACAQKYAHTIEFFDADSDGNGEYGELSELVELKSPFFDAELADGKAYEYRFATREASEGRFLTVAEPLNYEKTGGRTFAIDQTGQIRGGDAEGKPFGQISTVLPVLQGEQSAFYEIDDEIAKDVLNYLQSLSSSPEDQEKKQRILLRLRKDYSLTSVGRELEGMESTVNRFVTEQRAETLYLEAQAALEEGSMDVALARLTEIQETLSSFSKIAAVERELLDLRSTIAQQREMEAEALFREAEAKERQGMPQQEVQKLFHRIETLYPDTDTAERISTLKPELQRQHREQIAEEIFSELMDLSPEVDHERILNQANQLRRNYKDTDLFMQVEEDLAKKERKARAFAWRVKTEQSIAEGRMRGALAQLESAIRENPDLQYDLQDLCITLYRYMADTLMKEGDARGALTYYTRLNRMLKASESGEQVDPELMAKLHSEVGMDDYERKEYQEARWHLASAAWKYPDDAPFNMRLGASSLYSGLYQPADTALTQALKLQPDMEPALLYRAYLNMRMVLEFEKSIIEGFQNKDALEGEGFFQAGEEEADAGKSEEEEKEPESRKFTDADGNTYELGEEVDEESEQEREVRQRNKSISSATGYFSSLEGNEDLLDSAVPPPTDIDLVFRYNYDINRNILPDMLEFLRSLKEEVDGFQDDLSGLRPSEQNAVRLEHVMIISEYRNQLSDLRSTHLQNYEDQKELIGMMQDMRDRVDTAITDLVAAGKLQPHIQTLTENLLPQINEKRTSLYKSTGLLAGNMKSEYEIREKVFKLAEDALQDSMRSTSAGKRTGSDLSASIKNLLYRADDVSDIDQALVILRNSLEIKVDLKDILRAAEGVQ